MPDEVSTTTETKTASDGTVKISVEKYNDLLERAATPPVVNRTVISKTPEMVAKDYRMWGGGLMGLGASLFIIGAFCYKAGLSK